MLSYIKKVACPHRTIAFGRATLPLIIVYLFTMLFSGAPFSYADNTANNVNEKVYYYLEDHLGGIDVVTDEQGNVVERKDYMPYGDERLATGNKDENYGFTGKEKDDETGLMYYGARYYDPKIGRFTQMDPLILGESEKPLSNALQNPQELNGYSYVLNNPLKYTDPTGKIFEPLFDAIFLMFLKPETAYAPDEEMATGIAQGEIKSPSSNIVIEAVLLTFGKSVASKIVDYGFQSMKGSKLLKNLTDEEASNEGTAVKAKTGQKVYRVFGNEAKKYGRSWTPTNPKTMENPRNFLGLPDENSGEFCAEGRLKNTKNIEIQTAERIGKNQGGAIEYKIPNSKTQVRIDKVEKVNPKY